MPGATKQAHVKGTLEAAIKKAEELGCPERKAPGGCLQKHCCIDPGHQCFAKNDYWAECLVNCTPGPNPLDQVSPDPWSCEMLGERMPGTAQGCADENEYCGDVKCCKTPGTVCSAKNETFARCRAECKPGEMDYTDPDDGKPWTCKELGDRQPGLASWVGTKCSKTGQNCLQEQCCAVPGMQCYRKDELYGECRPTCIKQDDDLCTPVGRRTPKVQDSPRHRRVGVWVEETCTGFFEDCSESRCCLGVDAQCYETKEGEKPECMTNCNASEAGSKCKAIGPRSWSLATKGYPSLYCWSLYMPKEYEGPLMKEQLQKNSGIFQCDGYDVLAAIDDDLGKSKEGFEVKPLHVPNIPVGKSQDGTAGNAKLFMAVWDQVIKSGRFRNYDWTIKVDPDAVLMPARMRKHMEPHTGKRAFVINCNKYPGSPNFPMMYGAVEVFSVKAMQAYAIGSGKCGTELKWQAWGEDFYMTRCMDYLKVERILDFRSTGDGVCTGANCEDASVAAFHPFKTWSDWQTCWDTAAAWPDSSN